MSASDSPVLRFSNAAAGNRRDKRACPCETNTCASVWGGAGRRGEGKKGKEGAAQGSNSKGTNTTFKMLVGDTGKIKKAKCMRSVCVFGEGGQC